MSNTNDTADRSNDDDVYQAPDVKHHYADDNEVLRRLSNNDPDIAGLSVALQDEYSGNDDDWMENVGSAISQSTHLRTLTIVDDSDGRPPYGLPSFFMGLAKNRSIEHLTFHQFNHRYLNIFTTLAPFFEHNPNLRCIEITSCTNFVGKLSFLNSALAKTKHLKRLDLSKNDIGDAETSKFIKALSEMTRLQEALSELCLAGNHIKTKSCKCLNDWLSRRGSQIQRLYLQNNDLNNDCIKVLTSGLVANNFIKYVDLGNQTAVTAAGWQTFFQTALMDPKCSLESIGLSGNNIDDAGATALGNALAVNNRVKTLDISLWDTPITLQGWRGLNHVCKHPIWLWKNSTSVGVISLTRGQL